MLHRFEPSKNNPNLCGQCRFPRDHWMTQHEKERTMTDEPMYTGDMLDSPKGSGDVTVRNEGSIVLFYLNTDAAEEWWRESVQDGMVWGSARVVEHRYAADIIEGMQDDGLTVE